MYPAVFPKIQTESTIRCWADDRRVIWCLLSVIVPCLFCWSKFAYAHTHEKPRLRMIGKTPWVPFSHYTLARADHSEIDLFIARATRPAPTIVVFGGSKCLPVVMLRQERTVSALMFFADLAKQQDRVNVVVVEKRGLKSFGPPPESQEMAERMMQDAFSSGLYLKATRVNDGVAVVQALLADGSFQGIHLVGHSEGADIVSGICRRIAGRGIKSVALMAGAGPTRFFEASCRGRQETGALGVKTILDQEIFLSTTGNAKTPEQLQSVTYGLTSSPLDDLRGLNIPLFVAHGDADTKVPIAAADLFAAEMFRYQNQPLTYLMLPGLDHGFVDQKETDHSGAVLDYYVTWMLSGASGRSTKIGLLAAPVNKNVN